MRLPDPDLICRAVEIKQALPDELCGPGSGALCLKLAEAQRAFERGMARVVSTHWPEVYAATAFPTSGQKS